MQPVNLLKALVAVLSVCILPAGAALAQSAAPEGALRRPCTEEELRTKKCMIEKPAESCASTPPKPCTEDDVRKGRCPGPRLKCQGRSALPALDGQGTAIFFGTFRDSWGDDKRGLTS